MGYRSSYLQFGSSAQKPGGVYLFHWRDLKPQRLISGIQANGAKKIWDKVKENVCADVIARTPTVRMIKQALSQHKKSVFFFWNIMFSTETLSVAWNAAMPSLIYLSIYFKQA